jgi:hypothetical protein
MKKVGQSLDKWNKSDKIRTNFKNSDKIRTNF